MNTESILSGSFCGLFRMRDGGAHQILLEMHVCLRTYQIRLGWGFSEVNLLGTGEP